MTRTRVPAELLEEKKSIVKLKFRVRSMTPQKVKAEDLVKLAKHYYKMYEVSEDERSKSLCIGQAGYYGSWAVGKGYSDPDDIKLFIKCLELDKTMPNPDSTTEGHLTDLKKRLKELQK